MFTASTISNRVNLPYSVDWFKLTVDYLPDRMRRFSIFNFLYPPVAYIDLKYFEFLSDRYNALLETTITGQRMVLEKYLNYLFDPNNNSITILDKISNFETLYVYKNNETPDVGDDIYIYRRGEVIPVGGNQEYVFRKEEVSLNADFIVQIPTAIAPYINLQQIGAIVDKYKIAGTEYLIKII